MTFNRKEFERARFTPRTREIPVSELARFFGKSEPIWKLRNLTGEELGQVNEAADQASGMSKVISALASGEQGEAIKQILGMGDDVTADLAKRIEALLLGSIDPKVDRSTVVKLFANFPTQAYELSNAVFALTGLGSDPGK